MYRTDTFKSKLISGKIRVAENHLNFHTVRRAKSKSDHAVTDDYLDLLDFFAERKQVQYLNKSVIIAKSIFFSEGNSPQDIIERVYVKVNGFT